MRDRMGFQFRDDSFSIALRNGVADGTFIQKNKLYKLNSASGSSSSSTSSATSKKNGADDVPVVRRASKKRGTILSRGTLVVCKVSLVGQWIAEAKSKLSDPGLIYSYHGQNRKRDPNILAQNAIVVTTYEVLASDATYHREKSNDPDYCPPCEEIRWWRIICDESHSM